MKRQPPLLDRTASLLEATRTARRDCRWVAWRNGQRAFCRRTGCDQSACAEPPSRHLPGCAYGEGIGPEGVGGACSPRCVETAAVLAELAQQPRPAELERQPSLWQETA